MNVAYGFVFEVSSICIDCFLIDETSDLVFDSYNRYRIDAGFVMQCYIYSSVEKLTRQELLHS